MSGSFQPCIGTMRRWRSEHFSATSGCLCGSPVSAQATPNITTRVPMCQSPTANICTTDGGPGPLCLCLGQVRSTGEIHPWGRSGPVTDARLLHSSGEISLECWSYTTVSKLFAQWTDVNTLGFLGHMLSHSHSALLL